MAICPHCGKNIPIINKGNFKHAFGNCFRFFKLFGCPFCDADYIVSPFSYFLFAGINLAGVLLAWHSGLILNFMSAIYKLGRIEPVSVLLGQYAPVILFWVAMFALMLPVTLVGWIWWHFFVVLKEPGDL